MSNLSALLQILIENKAYYLKTKSGLMKLNSILTFYIRPSSREKLGEWEIRGMGNPGNWEIRGIGKSGDSEIREVLKSGNSWNLGNPWNLPVV